MNNLIFDRFPFNGSAAILRGISKQAESTEYGRAMLGPTACHDALPLPPHAKAPASLDDNDKETLRYFQEIMLQKRIDRMDMIERLTHAAASLSWRCHEEELHFFHVALRECGFRFNEGLIYYLRYFEWRLEHEAMPAQVSD